VFAPRNFRENDFHFLAGQQRQVQSLRAKKSGQQKARQISRASLCLSPAYQMFFCQRWTMACTVFNCPASSSNTAGSEKRKRWPLIVKRTSNDIRIAENNLLVGKCNHFLLWLSWDIGADL
jgi:hypothetical protein